MSSEHSFYRDRVTKMFNEKHSVLDIGGGLRVSKDRGDRRGSDNAWLEELVGKSDYKIMDPVATFNPDVIGDIHHMPFADNSLDAIVCSAILEHVENPILAAQELYRTLKPGGYCYAYVPFLYYYHPEKGYYKDFWRFTEDALYVLFKDFSTMEIEPIRGAIETWLHLNPATQKIEKIGRTLDRLFGKGAHQTKQVSGFAVFLTK